MRERPDEKLPKFPLRPEAMVRTEDLGVRKVRFPLQLCVLTDHSSGSKDTQFYAGDSCQEDKSLFIQA